ncbi:hypothetical protein BJ741DRAFT_534065, partial [Chytriomyces cf. hyalinus JEL632]
SLIDEMYDQHIGPFKQYGPAGSLCATPYDSASSIGSSSPSITSEADHTNFKAALVDRNAVCLFCWTTQFLHAAHIVAESTAVSNDLLSLVGLESTYQGQFRLLFCSHCYPALDALQRYVDVVNGKLVVKVVNHDNDPAYLERLGYLRAFRTEGCKYQRNAGNDKRNSDGEMELYFQRPDPPLQLNHAPLALHKNACLIWKMAGGANEDIDELCMEDDDEGNFQVDTTLRTAGWVESQGFQSS